MLTGQRRSGRDAPEAGWRPVPDRRQHHDLAASDRGLGFHIQQAVRQARRPFGTYGVNDTADNSRNMRMSE